MARTRVFISSTFYDLKHLRSSLDSFIESLGFDAIVSEKGNIAYAPDVPLDESCYRDVASADIFVMIVGGRYGSEVSPTKGQIPRNFFDRYSSVTRREYHEALERDVPTYILIERAVYAEYETYQHNKANESIQYAHVDSVNVFDLIDDVLTQPRNNPIQQFDRYAEIETWLREQWSGLFRELLQRMQSQAQIAGLQAQVAELAELNRTLKTYLEAVMATVAPQKSASLIESETRRLEDARLDSAFQEHPLTKRFALCRVPMAVVKTAVEDASSAESFLQLLLEAVPTARLFLEVEHLKSDALDEVEHDVNELRTLLGKAPFR